MAKQQTTPDLALVCLHSHDSRKAVCTPTMSLAISELLASLNQVTKPLRGESWPGCLSKSKLLPLLIWALQNICPLPKAGDKVGLEHQGQCQGVILFLRWDNSEVGGLFLAVIGSWGNKPHALTLLVDLTCWILCTRLYWAAGLWEAPAAQVLTEDNPIQFKAQSKLFGFPFLPSRLSLLPAYILGPWQIWHLLARNGKRACTEYPRGPPNLMTAKSLASGGKSDITQSARAWREPLIYIVCEMLCPEERQKILSGSSVTPGRYCFKNSGEFSSSPKPRRGVLFLLLLFKHQLIYRLSDFLNTWQENL